MMRFFSIADLPKTFKFLVGIFCLFACNLDARTQNFTLTITRSGSGSGVINSSPAGISCGATCSFNYPAGTVVNLIATGDAISAFSGWSGDITGSDSPIAVTMDSDKSINALFTRLTYSLNISVDGSGIITSSPNGIACPSDCSEGFTVNTSVVLTAVPDQGSVFKGWSGGGCSGTGSCTVSVISNTSVSASFCELPGSPGIISGETSICGNTALTYSISAVPNAINYIWSLPAGWIGSSNTNTINVIPGESGTISVKARNSCGDSDTRSLPVTVNAVPVDIKISAGMVAFYPLDTLANDASGNGNGGIINGTSPATDRSGKAKAALEFNGTSDYIDLGDRDMLNPHLNSMTITAWVKKDVLNQHSRIISKGTHGGSQPGYDLMFYGNSGPTKAAVIFSAGGHEHIVYSDNPIDDLLWHHYAGVIDRQGYVSLYVDGIKQIGSAYIGFPHQNEDIGAQTYKAFIGASYSNYGNPGPISEYFKGLIDEVKIFSRVLIHAEIKALMHPMIAYSEKDSICENESTTILLLNSQTDVSYQLQNNGIDVGIPQSGNGDTLRFNINGLAETAECSIRATNGNGTCSIILDTILTITVNPVYEYHENKSICAGETYNWHGTGYTDAGSYTANYSTIHGCDSIYTLNLMVNPVFEFNENHVICEGETYTWHGTGYTDAGTYTANYHTILGCDSTYVLNLTLYPHYEHNESAVICNGETFAWHGTDYIEAGIYSKMYQTSMGCDSIFTLQLTVNTIDASVTVNDQVITATEIGAAYQWLSCDNGMAVITGETSQSLTVEASGAYVVKITRGTCTDTSICTSMIISGMALLQNDDLFIYPNPVKEELIIENGGTKKTRYEILNASGRIILSGSFLNKTVLNMSGFNPGIYLVKLRNGSSVEIRKIIKE